MSDVPLHQLMRYAAAILEQANERYNLHPDAPCSASWLRNEARHVEDEDKEAAEKEALAKELAREVSETFAWNGGAGSWDNLPSALQAERIRCAHNLVESGWTKS